MMSSDQPLLQVTDGAVGQRHYGFRAFTQLDQHRLAARRGVEPGFLQAGEAFQAVGVYG